MWKPVSKNCTWKIDHLGTDVGFEEVDTLLQ